jgi:hypothetical protein
MLTDRGALPSATTRSCPPAFNALYQAGGIVHHLGLVAGLFITG